MILVISPTKVYIESTWNITLFYLGFIDLSIDTFPIIQSSSQRFIFEGFIYKRFIVLLLSAI